MHRDMEMWLSFMETPTVYARGFMDFDCKLNANTIQMYSNASGSKVLGMGGVCGTSWMYAKWPENFIQDYNPSIEYLELYALLATVLNWIHRYQNKRVILFCDNQSVVHMVNDTTSSCRNCMVLMRRLVMKGMIENVRIFATYIKSQENTAADYLSRLWFEDFHRLQKDWDAERMEVPAEIWPPTKLWVN